MGMAFLYRPAAGRRVAGRIVGFLETRASATFTAERETCSKWVPDFGFAGRARFVAMRQQ
jgi:hypothetical protein